MDQKIRNIAEEYAKSVREEQLELLRTLGKIPAPTRMEDMRAAFCKDWFLSNGADDVTIDSAKNVICRIGCGDADELVVFQAHTDIVFPDIETLKMEEDGQRIHAPGIGDDTANLVNLMMAAKYLLKNKVKLKYSYLIIANACEEGLGNLDGTKAVFAEYGSRIKFFYSFDGYMSQCTSTAVGSYRYRVSAKAEGGHSYLHFGRANAIEIICALVEDLYRIKVPSEAKTTYNVGYIEGGTTVNSIAQEASMLYEFRSTSQACLEEMEKSFNLAIEMSKARGHEVATELLGVRPGNGPVDKDVLKAFTAESEEVIKAFYDGSLDYDAYSTDANIPLSLGIPGNTIGTVKGNGAHTREEWIDKSSMTPGLEIALSLMLKYAIL